MSSIEPNHPTVSRRGAMARTAALSGALLLASRTARAVDAGAVAPVIDLPGLDGPVSLHALRGKLVLLDFWASWCTPCKLSFPWMNALQSRLGVRGFQVLAINVDRQRDAADAFLRQTPAKFLVGFDAAGDVPRRYAVKAMPTSLLIAPDGQVLLRHPGFRDDDRPALEAAIDRALERLAK